MMIIVSKVKSSYWRPTINIFQKHEEGNPIGSKPAGNNFKSLTRYIRFCDNKTSDMNNFTFTSDISLFLQKII